MPDHFVASLLTSVSSSGLGRVSRGQYELGVTAWLSQKERDTLVHRPRNAQFTYSQWAVDVAPLCKKMSEKETCGGVTTGRVTDAQFPYRHTSLVSYQWPTGGNSLVLLRFAAVKYDRGCPAQRFICQMFGWRAMGSTCSWRFAYRSIFIILVTTVLYIFIYYLLLFTVYYQAFIYSMATG